jgi:plasminogen activator
LNAGFWMGVNEGVDGEMYDFDWLDETTSAWTDRSRSEVDVVDAMIFDANLSFKVIEGAGYCVGVVGGIMYETWEWDDRGQEYTYSVRGFRDISGSFEGENVIDYRQTFLIPYIGVEGSADLGAVSIQGYLTYTPLVAAWDEDHHLLRDLHFEETFTGGEYLAVGVSATVDIGEAMFVQGSIDLEKVDEIRGELEVVETGTTIDNAAGIAHESTTISLSLGIRL